MEAGSEDERHERHGCWLELVIAGSVAILIALVNVRSREQLRITIDSGPGDFDGFAAPIDSSGPRGNGGTTSSGYRLTGDRTMVDDGLGGWVPYNPMVHGDLPTDSSWPLSR